MLHHTGTVPLATPRMLLRPYRLSDAEDIFSNYGGDQRVTRHLSWQAYEKVEQVQAYLSQVIPQYANPHIYHWVLEYEHRAVGSISVTQLDQRNEACELGYCLGYSYWNKGLATEALKAVLLHLAGPVNMHRIYAKHDVNNPASGAVMKKAGLQYEGRLRGHYRKHDGSYSDALLYAVLAEEITGSAVNPGAF